MIDGVGDLMSTPIGEWGNQLVVIVTHGCEYCLEHRALVRDRRCYNVLDGEYVGIREEDRP